MIHLVVFQLERNLRLFFPENKYFFCHFLLSFVIRMLSFARSWQWMSEKRGDERAASPSAQRICMIQKSSVNRARLTPPHTFIFRISIVVYQQFWVLYRHQRSTSSKRSIDYALFSVLYMRRSNNFVSSSKWKRTPEILKRKFWYFFRELYFCLFRAHIRFEIKNRLIYDIFRREIVEKFDRDEFKNHRRRNIVIEYPFITISSTFFILIADGNRFDRSIATIQHSLHVVVMKPPVSV